MGIKELEFMCEIFCHDMRSIVSFFFLNSKVLDTFNDLAGYFLAVTPSVAQTCG